MPFSQKNKNKVEKKEKALEESNEDHQQEEAAQNLSKKWKYVHNHPKELSISDQNEPNLSI